MSAILTLNAGSSSIKFAAYTQAEAPQLVGAGQVERIGGVARLDVDGTKTATDACDHASAVQAILGAIRPMLGGGHVAAVGHRIVHGGPDYAAPMVLTADVLTTLAGLIPLAPLHQPHNLAAVNAAQAAFTDAVQVGCFDTAFHQGHAFANDTYGLPRAFYDRGIRRYGFHGLSYDYIAGVLRRDFPDLAAGRVVVAHLGNGASLCGMRDGRSVSTTMGFSALDGLAMGTRCGQIDPGVILYLLDQGMGAPELTDLLYRQSGMLGLSGISHDMRTLLDSDAPEAAQALDYYIERLRREIGAMAATLGGIDALVFCGGVGENAAPIRARTVDGLAFLGLTLDSAANSANSQDIGSGAARILIIPTDEELVIARAATALLT
ncbi:MAG: acetate/propionate family kinase [Pseudomonadota bacterium]|nr:acetate/propionate family kinase [Pseudomonadota bacterium]